MLICPVSHDEDFPACILHLLQLRPRTAPSFNAGTTATRNSSQQHADAGCAMLRGCRLEISGSCASCARLLAAFCAELGKSNLVTAVAIHVNLPSWWLPRAHQLQLLGWKPNDVSRGPRDLSCHGLLATACSSCAMSAIRCPRGFRSSLQQLEERPAMWRIGWI